MLWYQYQCRGALQASLLKRACVFGPRVRDIQELTYVGCVIGLTESESSGGAYACQTATVATLIKGVGCGLGHVA